MRTIHKIIAVCTLIICTRALHALEAPTEQQNDEIVFEAVVASAANEEAFIDPMAYTPKTFLPPLGEYEVLVRPVTYQKRAYRILLKFKKNERDIAKAIARQIGEGFVTANSSPAQEAPAPTPAKKNAPAAPSIITTLQVMGVCSAAQPFLIGRAQNLLKDSKIMQAPAGPSFNVPGKQKMCSLIFTTDKTATTAELAHIGKEIYFMTQHTIEELLKEMPGLPTGQ